MRSAPPPPECLRSYDGVLWFDPLDEARRRRLVELAAATPQIVDLGPASLEISYDGRETSGFVVTLLRTLASLLHDAQGEVCCETQGDDGSDPTFEFYSIRGGRLQVQDGAIERGPVRYV